MRTGRNKGIRWAAFGLALAVSAGCWVWTFGTLMLFGHPGAAAWTAMVTISAIATEITLWVGAFTLGWSIFEKRRLLWARMWRGLTARFGGLV